jgi:hypothetical protein
MVHQPTSLDAPVGEDGDATLADLIKAPDAVDPRAAALQRIVSEVLADLTPREQRILRMRFGIGSTAAEPASSPSTSARQMGHASMAGLCDQWTDTDTGVPVRSWIIVTAANALTRTFMIGSDAGIA